MFGQCICPCIFLSASEVTHIAPILEYFLFNKIFFRLVSKKFFENMCHKIPKKYLTFEIRLKMVHCEQSKVYYEGQSRSFAHLRLEAKYRG